MSATAVVAYLTIHLRYKTVVKIPLYEGLESSYEDIMYQFLRRTLELKNHSIRIKRAGYPELDSIIPSAASGKIGSGSCDAYIFKKPYVSGLCGLIELESTGKLSAGVTQIRKYAAGFVEKALSSAQVEAVRSIEERELKLVVFDGRSIYLSNYNLDKKTETIIINSEKITADNHDFLTQQLLSQFPHVTQKNKIDEDELIRSTAKIIRGHEKLQRSKALLMTLLASIYGATGEPEYTRALDAIRTSQSDYDVKLYNTYRDFLHDITEENDKGKIRQLYEQVAISLFDLSKDQGMDLYGFIYEELASKENKKEHGEYYTPRHTIRPILKSVFENYLEWDESTLNKKIVLDPFCGSGGFLYEYIEIIKKKFNLSSSDIDEIAGKSLWGFDKSSVLGAYLNLFLAGDGSANVHRVKTSINWRKFFIYKDDKNKLSRLQDIKAIKYHLKQNLSDINKHLKMFAGFDVQITEYDIDRYTEHDSPVDAFALTLKGLLSSNKDERYLGNVDLLVTNVPYGSVTEKREQFIEAGQPIYGASLEANALRECIDYLKPAIRQGKNSQAGGICIAIVPDSVLENPTAKPIRDYLISRCDIHAIISLPPFTFAPYAMEKTYVLVFQKRAPEEFSYDRTLSQVFMYDSICDGKANSVNRYKTDHTAKYSISDYKGNTRIVEAFLHNDFDPFFDSFEPSGYSYLSKLEWAWRRDFANYNLDWDQERVTEVWSRDKWRVLPGKKWGYLNLVKYKRKIQKEVRSSTLYNKIHSFIEDNGLEPQLFCDDFESYRAVLLQQLRLSANETQKLKSVDFASVDSDNGVVTFYENQEIEDIDLNPSSHRYLGVAKESYDFGSHIKKMLETKFSSLDSIIQSFSHDFYSHEISAVRLGTEFEVLQGTQFSKIDAYKNPGDIAVFTAATDGPAYYVSDDIFGKTLIQGPSLIWSRKGAKAGTVQKYDEKNNHGQYLPFFISDVSGTIKPKPNKIDHYDLDFLLVYFSGLLRNERTSNGNNAQVNKSKIENLTIYLPDIETQKAVGDIVRKLTP